MQRIYTTTPAAIETLGTRARISPKSAQDITPLHEGPGQSPLDVLSGFARETITQERALARWEQRLDRGYTPTDRELLTIQRLVFSTTQRIELAAKLISSIQSTLNRLKDTPL